MSKVNSRSLDPIGPSRDISMSLLFRGLFKWPVVLCTLGAAVIIGLTASADAPASAIACAVLAPLLFKMSRNAEMHRRREALRVGERDQGRLHP